METRAGLIGIMIQIPESEITPSKNHIGAMILAYVFKKALESAAIYVPSPNANEMTIGFSGGLNDSIYMAGVTDMVLGVKTIQQEAQPLNIVNFLSMGWYDYSEQIWRPFSNVQQVQGFDVIFPQKMQLLTQSIKQ